MGHRPENIITHTPLARTAIRAYWSLPVQCVLGCCVWSIPGGWLLWSIMDQRWPFVRCAVVVTAATAIALCAVACWMKLDARRTRRGYSRPRQPVPESRPAVDMQRVFVLPHFEPEDEPEVKAAWEAHWAATGSRDDDEVDAAPPRTSL